MHDDIVMSLAYLRACIHAGVKETMSIQIRNTVYEISLDTTFKLDYLQLGHAHGTCYSIHKLETSTQSYAERARGGSLPQRRARE